MKRKSKSWRDFVLRYKKHILLIIVFLYLSLCFYSACSDSLAGDEGLYMHTMYKYVHTFDPIDLRDLPYLLHAVNIVPILVLDDVGYYPDKDFIQATHDTGLDPQVVLFLCRIPSILLGLLLMYYIYRWARKLFGIEVGILALLIFVLDGNLSAHFHLISVDTAVTAFTFIAIYYFWEYFSSKTDGLRNFILFLVFSVLTLIAKISGFYLLLILIALSPLIILSKKTIVKYPFCKLRKIKTKAKLYFLTLLTAFIIMGLALSVIYFGFSTMKEMVPEGMEDRAESKLDTVGNKFPLLNNTMRVVYEKVPLPMPVYIKTFAQQLAHSYEDVEVYLFGKFSDTGFKTYYLFSFFVKMPVLIIALSIIFLVAFVFYYPRINKKYDYWFLLIPIIIIWLLNSINHVQLGFKYVFQSLPFLYIIIASLLVIVKSKHFRIILLILIIMSAGEFVLNFENPIAYQNSVSQINPLDYYTFDGSLDWGQNGIRIIDYIEDNNIDPASVYMHPDYNHVREFYNVGVYTLEDINQIVEQDRLFYVFISKARFNCLQLPKPCYTWLNEENTNIKNIGTIAKSIEVYEVNG